MVLPPPLLSPSSPASGPCPSKSTNQQTRRNTQCARFISPSHKRSSCCTLSTGSRARRWRATGTALATILILLLDSLLLLAIQLHTYHIPLRRVIRRSYQMRTACTLNAHRLQPKCASYIQEKFMKVLTCPHISLQKFIPKISPKDRTRTHDLLSFGNCKFLSITQMHHMQSSRVSNCQSKVD